MSCPPLINHVDIFVAALEITIVESSTFLIIIAPNPTILLTPILVFSLTQAPAPINVNSPIDTFPEMTAAGLIVQKSPTVES
ncbi:hypothetical protein D3C75_975310 [compost metagenome]